jgi:hypothetical protein
MWSGSRSAEEQFPYYIKKLICAVIQPDQIRMPSGDAIWLPGHDGELLNAQKSRFIPEGLSVWEVGTEPSFKTKASKDYTKRSKDKTKKKKGKAQPKLNRSETTFVFVTPHIWMNKDLWVTERKVEGIWKDVIVIDGVDLVDWLEIAPAVSLQLAAEMGIVPSEGVQTLDMAWEEWSHYTNPAVSDELLVIGREEQEEKIIERLEATPNTFIVRGDSPREAYGFTLAVLRRLNMKEKNLAIDARIIISENEGVAQGLRYFNNLIIVLKQTRSQVSGDLSSRGFYVVVPEGNSIHSDRNVIELARPIHHKFVEALGRMGLPSDEAERTARECGLSVTILQRHRAVANFKRPTWSEDEYSLPLLPAVLAGRWNNKSEADKKILCILAKTEDYSTVEAQLKPFLWVDETPLRLIDDMWTLTAPADAFQLTARYLSDEHLGLFKDVFKMVFGKIDPKVEIPPNDWLYYDIRGEKGNSSWLRSGLAETLLLIAENGTNAQLISSIPLNIYADSVVKGLPGLHDDWRVLASLRDQYARLMEATPGPLLDSLEHLLEAKPDDIRRLFIEGSPIFGGGTLHTGLLWGLETMAWSPEYLPQVALILAKLASLDPGMRMGNRPINSLREIFLWWSPGTNATVEQRVSAIDLILKYEPKIGWDLLSKLLPEGHSVSMRTAMPRWRDFGDLAQDAHTGRGQFQYVSSLADRALDLVGNDPNRWSVILNSLRRIPSVQRGKALDLLKTIADGSIPSDKKILLWNILREFIYQHRTYREASWVLPVELIDELDKILSLLSPADPIERNKWLFDEWLPGLPDGENGIERHQEKVNELRQKAADEILKSQGIEGLVKLGTSCKYPGFLVSAAAPLLPQINDLHTFVGNAIASGESGIFLASHISAQAQQLHRNKWRDLIRKDIINGTWSTSIAASLIIWWPDEMTTWKDAEALGIATDYWKKKPVIIIRGNPDEQAYQVDNLILARRASHAFSQIRPQMDDIPTNVLLRLFDATMSEIAQAKSAEDINRLGISADDVQGFLAKLHHRQELPREELARREFQALPLIRLSDVQGLTLHEFMAEDSNFFVEVVCAAFLPAHRDINQDKNPTEEEKARGQVAYTLLNGMSLIPGLLGTDLSESKLVQWVDEVRTKATELDRAVIADQQIGQILAHSPADHEDTGWPCQGVRNMIERLKNDNVDQGLRIARFNMRGAFSKDPYEGGAQERNLASQYREWAGIARAKWPRTSRVLENMAQEWEEDARREDARSEQYKLE